MRYKYAIYYRWLIDGMQDSFNVKDAQERDLNIKTLIESGDKFDISYCRIYANGEDGKRIEIDLKTNKKIS